MAIRVALNHQTHYTYDRAIKLDPHVVRLRPAVHSRTPIEAYRLKITPETHFINWQQDPFGNYLGRLVFPEKTTELKIEVDLIAEMTVINPFDFFLEEYAEHYPFKYEKSLKKELKTYLEIKENDLLLQRWISKIDTKKQRTIDFLVAINHRLQQDIKYNVRMEVGIQSCETTLSKRSGSCRDSAWLLVQILRHMGLAARFVSGYLIQLTSDVKSLDGPSGPSQDFTDLHAWTEVYLPGAGWVGLDSTSGLFAGEGHIPLACTPDPSSAAPITGIHEKCEVAFEHHNNIQRIHEDPRVTKPYTEEQWSAVLALGSLVESQLQQADVRLSMGGEPTFVAIDDMDAAEWNTDADGKHKRKLAANLFQRLQQHFGKGGMPHYAQGKWYPGEALPRWKMAWFWRRDGIAIWNKPHLQADPRRNYGFDYEQAQQFIQLLSVKLQLSTDYCQTAYEDSLYNIWKEGTLPINIDLQKHDLGDAGSREQLLRLLQGDLGKPCGYVLPLKWNYKNQRWHSSLWPLRREYLYLLPGNSPMGLRLPLDSLPWVDKEKREQPSQRCAFADNEPLPDYFGEVSQRFSTLQPNQDTLLADAKTPLAETEIIHTALCIEARQGCLYIFMPPLSELEHYLQLVNTIESCAQQLKLPVCLEGYAPPNDPRLEQMAVTPDPGVIEVNIHPAKNWNELVTNTEILYQESRLARLSTEKFMLDGRHSGTGGGNHITIGGLVASDSPILRRPDLLRSLLTYWQHHPGLSYLFSGLFIGPTSQAPRIDEARNESLYELEIAFQQMPTGNSSQPWLVDRLLRNILVDLTGNTHRTEFCIDKLYSPDSATGRLGLVEFRGFEMPPHARMSIVQMLLLRIMIARFWQKPYQHKLVRWNTMLHDRFMLPHYVWQDIKDVVTDLNDSGYPFRLEWLNPFLEFRFPHYGRVRIGDINMELQTAIEPWHVLGEEMTQAGTARFVDSSVERLQVKLQGLTESRYIVACNGRRLPLRNTGTQGEYVAGVRYRAWQPPSALHPTIGVHAPLVFDIIDSWNGRSIGGCTYHVSHPGGLSHEHFPINAYEAETRRISRFWGYGHTPGPIQPPPDTSKLSQFYPHQNMPKPMQPPQEEINPEYPYTLDLRKT